MTGTVREYLYAGGEAPTAMRARQADGSYKNYFFITNTHGDVVALTDRDGNIVNRYAYGPWGEATRVSESVHQPFRYAGYRYEDGFDLYYLRARWYDAGTGRFLSRDVRRLGNHPLLSNRYIYGDANPSTNVDSEGTSARRPFDWTLDLVAQITDVGQLHCVGLNLYSTVEGSTASGVFRYHCGSIYSAAKADAPAFRFHIDVEKANWWGRCCSNWLGWGKAYQLTPDETVWWTAEELSLTGGAARGDVPFGPESIDTANGKYRLVAWQQELGPDASDRWYYVRAQNSTNPLSYAYFECSGGSCRNSAG